MYTEKGQFFLKPKCVKGSWFTAIVFSGLSFWI